MSISVALLFGGRSGEHGISCVTAGGILRAIDRDRFTPIPIGITPSGRLVSVTDDPDHWVIRDGRAPEVPEDGEEVLLPTVAKTAGKPSQLRVIRGGRVEHLADVDVFLPLLHGPYGEDGTIQGLFDLLDLPYVGSGVLASAVCMDKDFTKRVLADAGIAVADGCVVRQEDWCTDEGRAEIRARVAELQAPLFVKPSRAGSSLGVSRIEDLDGLEEALRSAFEVDPKVLVEAGVNGREVECGVLRTSRRHPVRSTQPGEVAIGDDLEFYDFESKYFGKGTVRIDVPASISEERAAQVRDIAERAFVALDLETLARVDVFVTDSGVIVNEINTMPGFTPFSMFPVLWENMGITYRELITELIDSALAKPLGVH
ncbi:D-alanine--D-alanine ligase family protein [Helcobacillus massiliensis]|uniref:D-alanine--D-alanine ligase family protein n=1 Tax=Helcobacillus massiliensis TaxID=521392 RepID=UPI0025573EC2|nr:D-alanine--D-alanine ligase family protein [Helcobacillus massiliensis]MDK7742123.1 D-alanine--D-alanine ligase family protein [Helcobacillus massiliensis]WOO93678.1 D-alanine--D-alanine ligase family protein [Helcobacillus massiliensis]